MNRTHVVTGVVGIVVIASGAFYGGMTYGKSVVPSRGQGGNGQFGVGSMRRTANGGFVSGAVLTKDATSITIKTRDGSTKIVLVSPSTQVMKSASGSFDDVAVGADVIATGAANADGSVSAQSLQIRPVNDSGRMQTPGDR